MTPRGFVKHGWIKKQAQRQLASAPPGPPPQRRKKFLPQVVALWGPLRSESRGPRAHLCSYRNKAFAAGRGSLSSSLFTFLWGVLVHLKEAYRAPTTEDVDTTFTLTAHLPSTHTSTTSRTEKHHTCMLTCLTMVTRCPALKGTA